MSEASSYRKRRSPEHSFQAWADRLIDRVVLAPMFVTGIDHAGQITDNARARMAARGVRFGLPDMFVAQLPGCPPGISSSISAWIELKRGSRLSTTQEGVHIAMRRAGQRVYVCNTLPQVVDALCEAGFAMHLNAPAIAEEFEQRLAAKEAAPRSARQGKPKPRGAKVTASQIAELRRAGAWG